MTYGKRTARIVFTLTLLLAMQGRAAAVAPEIKDEAKFFSAEAIKKANEQILEIARKFERDLLIETVAGVAAESQEKVKSMSKEERSKFFDTWAKERAEKVAVNGVYILVCKEPSYVQIELYPKSRGPLDNQLRTKLREILVEQFRDKKFDEGLLAAVKMVREKLTAKP